MAIADRQLAWNDLQPCGKQKKHNWDGRLCLRCGFKIHRRKKISQTKIKILKEQQDNKCFYCKQELNEETLTVDHKTPISRQGTDAIENLCLACKKCNLEKNNLTLEEFKMHLPMLAESMDKERLMELVSDNSFCFQQKVDGDRMIVEVDNGAVTVYNRDGKEYTRQVKVLRPVIKEFSNPEFFKGVWLFDGEYINRKYYVFDLIKVINTNGVNIIQDATYHMRLDCLNTIFNHWAPNHIMQLPSHLTSKDKEDFLDKVDASNSEGVIARRMTAPYQSGARTTNLLKFKFVETADLRVTGINEQASISLECADDIPIGNCTMSATNLRRVKIGDIVEIRYLYVGKSNRLYQPAFMRIRNDKSEPDPFGSLKLVNKDVLV